MTQTVLQYLIMSTHFPQSNFLSRTLDADPSNFEQFSRRSYGSQQNSYFRNTFHKKNQTSSILTHLAKQLNRTMQTQKHSLDFTNYNSFQQQKPYLAESSQYGVIKERKRPKSHLVRSLRKQQHNLDANTKAQLFDSNFIDNFNKLSRAKKIAPKRMPLSFLKPQGKYALGKSMEEVKSTLYEEVERVPNFKIPPGHMIEYVTDYRQNQQKISNDRLVYKPKKCQNPSFLRQKLRSKVKQQSKRYQQQLMAKACTVKARMMKVVSI